MSGEKIGQNGRSDIWSTLKNVVFAGKKESKPANHGTTMDLVGDLPTTSEDEFCQAYLRAIERSGKMSDVKEYLSRTISTESEIYDSARDFESANPDYYSELNASMSYQERDAILEYSGLKFAWINSVARGFWSYDKMGRKTPELEAEIKTAIREVTAAIDKAPTPEEDFTVFRGTNLDGFRNYGINAVEDLIKMKGQFMLEKGFTSTAIVREKSFADRQKDGFWIGSSNVEVRYHVPAGHHTGIALLSSDLSYSPEQTEYLINRNSLMYVSDVTIDRAGHATIDAVVIPDDVYDTNQYHQ